MGKKKDKEMETAQCVYTIDKKALTYIEALDSEDLKNLVMDYYDYDELAIIEGDKIVDILYSLVEDYKGLQVKGNGGVYNRWFEIMIVAAYFYIGFYDEEHPNSSLFMVRDTIKETADNNKVDPGTQEMIFQLIESSNGYWGSSKLKPPVDTPAELFTLAIFLYKNQDKVYSKKERK